MAMVGGPVFGLAVSAALTTVVDPSSEGGFVLGGIVAGLGLALMVAATLRD
jgi:hypothetical protein